MTRAIIAVCRVRRAFHTAKRTTTDGGRDRERLRERRRIVRGSAASTSDAALKRLAAVPISLHCWQGDDVGGFEQFGTASAAASPRPATIPARRARLTTCAPTRRWRCRSSPASTGSTCTPRYGEFGGKTVDRDEIGPEHFAGWIDWAKALGIGLDFNPTYFSHPKAADNFTLSHPDPAIRAVLDRSRHRLPPDRRGHGQCARHAVRHEPLDPRRHEGHAGRPRRPARAADRSLDAMFKEQSIPRTTCDAVEGKLFGIGCESYTVGSHEFYSATRCRARSCSRSTPATTTRPRPSPTRSARC